MEHDQLQMEEDFGIDARSARIGSEILHHLPHEGEIEPLLKTSIEVVFWDEIFEGDVLRRRAKVALLRTHHSGASCWNGSGEQCYRSFSTSIQYFTREDTRISTAWQARRVSLPPKPRMLSRPSVSVKSWAPLRPPLVTAEVPRRP